VGLWVTGVQAAIRALALHAEDTLFPVLRGSFPVALGGAELRGRVRAPEAGGAGDWGWPCWGGAEKECRIYWTFIHREKGRPSFPHAVCV